MIGADSSDPGVVYTSPATQRVSKVKETLGAEEDDNADDESPVRVTLETRKAVIRRKAAKKRQQTLQTQREEHDATRAAIGQAAVAANEAMRACTERESEDAREACFVACLETLKAANQSWGNFVEWVSDPSSKQAQDRFDGLFKNRTLDPETHQMNTQVGRILDLWASRNSKTGREDVRTWAVRFTCNVINCEANVVSRDGVLLTRADRMTDSYLRSFNMSSVYERIRSLCPSTTEIMRHLTTTTRQRTKAQRSSDLSQAEQTNAERREAKKLTVGFQLTSNERDALTANEEDWVCYDSTPRRSESEEQSGKERHGALPVRHGGPAPGYLHCLELRTVLKLH